MDNIIFSLNIVAPIFLLVLLGVFLKKVRLFEASFFSACDKLVFRIGLPCLLFLDIAEASFSDIDTALILFCAAAVTAFFLLSILLVPLFLKSNADRGAFIQGACRSNAAILGIPIATNLFGQTGAVVIASTLPVVIGLYNIYSIIVLTIFAPLEQRPGKRETIRRIIRSTCTNPLLIAILLGLLWNLSGLTLPLFLSRSANYLANITVPLSLLSLGACFSLQALHKDLLAALVSSCCKTIILPLAAIAAAWACGISHVGTGVILVLFGGPTAISSYSMAKEMGSNHLLAGEIMLLSTFMSSFTLFAGIVICKNLLLF